MIEMLRKLALLIGPGHRGRWLAVIAMAVLVSIVEAVSTFGVFAMLSLLVGEAGELEFPIVGDLRELVPWQDDVQLLAVLGSSVAVIFLARSGLILLQDYMQFRVAENAGARLSTRLLDGYLSMPYVFHLERNSSELVRNAFDSVRRFVDEGLIPGTRVMGKLAIVVGVLAILVLKSPLVTLLATGTLGLFAWIVLRAVHPRVKRLGRTAQSMAQQSLQRLQESLNGVRDITVLGRERTFVDAYRQAQRQLARARYLRQTAGQVPRVAIETGIVLFIVGYVWTATLAQGGVGAMLPQLGLFGYGAARLMPEMQQIVQGLNSLKFVGPAIDDLTVDLEALAANSGNAGQSVSTLKFNDSIVAEGVRYRYPGASGDALVDVHMRIPRGQSVGVIGPTGGGKSTLVDVLLGLLVPTEGEVRVDGVDVHANARSWQENIGVVPQAVFLIDGTLRTNIALGVPEGQVDEDSLHGAVRMAQLEEFVASLPNKLETMVGEGGVRLSGGQRQRVAIARALYRGPSVLVLDEGTASLDMDTEQALMGAVERLRGNQTMIVVAHRLVTVEKCDLVLLVRDGRIVDRGSMAELSYRHAELRASGEVGRGVGSREST